MMTSTSTPTRFRSSVSSSPAAGAGFVCPVCESPFRAHEESRARDCYVRFLNRVSALEIERHKPTHEEPRHGDVALLIKRATPAVRGSLGSAIPVRLYGRECEECPRSFRGGKREKMCPTCRNERRRVRVAA